MMTLSERQIKMIRAEVEQNRLTNETLKDDLIDHLCCMTEAKANEGTTFEASLKEALFELAPEGLKEIERETIMLLNNKKNIFT